MLQCQVLTARGSLTQKEAEVSLLVVIALEKIYKRALLRTVKDPTKRFGTLNSSIRVLNFADYLSLFLIQCVWTFTIGFLIDSSCSHF